MIGDETIADRSGRHWLNSLQKKDIRLSDYGSDDVISAEEMNARMHFLRESTLSFELRCKAVANSESQEKFRVYTGKIQGLSEHENRITT